MIVDSSKHFSREELQCKHTGKCEMNARFMEKIESLRGVLDAANRGAEVTHRLLAFSRKQPLRPGTIRLGSLAACLRKRRMTAVDWPNRDLRCSRYAAPS